MASPPRFDRRDFLGLATVGFAGVGCADSPRSASSSGEPGASEFLLEPGLVYLNTVAIGPTSRRVIDAVHAASRESERNPTQFAYSRGVEAMDGVRARLAQFVGAKVSEIALTSSTTEGMGLVASGIDLEAGDHVLTTNQEHAGGVSAWRHLARRRGIVVDEVALPVGESEPARIVDLFARALHPRARVISVSHVLFATGVTMPIRALSDLAREHRALCVVDGAQALGNLPIDLPALGCDAYAAGGHKWLLGPKGTGFLFISERAADRIAPAAWSDGPGAYTASTGVRNASAILGFGAALDLAASLPPSALTRRLQLAEQLDQALRGIPGISVASPPSGARTTPIVTFSVPPGSDSRSVQSRLLETHRIQLKALPAHLPSPLPRCLRASIHDFNSASDARRLETALMSFL